MTDSYPFAVEAINYESTVRGMDGKAEPEIEKPFHYFASSFLNWATDADLGKCLNKIKKADRTDNRAKAKFCMVWRVPEKESAHYKISEFRPEVDGTEFIDYVYY